MIYRTEINNLNHLFVDKSFSMDKWEAYIEDILPGLKVHILNDVSGYNFNKDILPVVNNVYKNKERVIKLEKIFYSLVKEIDNKILAKLNRNLDCEIILYLGLCSGAGWVTNLNGKTLILLGVEKILELNLDNNSSLRQLIYHELGHVYQQQYGTLNKEFDDYSDKLLWQLYTEGIAVYFEQNIISDNTFNNSNLNSLKEGLEKMLPKLKIDFKKDLKVLNDRFTQRYFGDWVSYNGYKDAGYFLGEKFINYLCQTRCFNDILDLSIEEIKIEYGKFCVI